MGRRGGIGIKSPGRRALISRSGADGAPPVLGRKIGPDAGTSDADGSEALRVALELAKTCGAQLTLLHVWELPIYPYMDLSLNSDLIARMERSAAERLAAEVEVARKVLPEARTALIMAEPWAGIIDAIHELRPDLVVIGTHGRRGLSHVLLGSVAEKVVRLSPAPVLTVRATET